MDETTPALASPESLEDQKIKSIPNKSPSSNQHQGGEDDISPKSDLQNITEANNSQKISEEQGSDSDSEKRSITSSDNVAVLTVDNNKHCFSNIDLCLDDEKTLKTESFNNEADSKEMLNQTDEKTNKFTQIQQRVKNVLEKLSVEHYELPPDPNWQQKLQHSLLLPPHGTAAEISTLILIILTFWITW